MPKQRMTSLGNFYDIPLQDTGVGFTLMERTMAQTAELTPLQASDLEVEKIRVGINKLVENMDFQEYLDEPDFLHSTDLKLLAQSINHWLAKSSFEQTKALKLGQLGHTMILEINKLTERYLVMPKVDGRTTKGQEQKLLAEAQAKEEGKILISQDEFTQALGWRDNILKNPITQNVFQMGKGRNEISGFFEHPEYNGIKGAFRVDKLLFDDRICIDLKIMLSAHPYAFQSSVKKFRYDIQAAWYLDGLKIITGDDYDFLFVVCEKSNPFNVQTYRLSDKTLAKAREDIGLIIQKYNEFKGANDHQKTRLSGYYDGIQTLDIKWY